MNIEPRGRMRAAVVMEQALGHVTYYRNFRHAAEQQADVDASFLPIPFDVSGATRLVPLLRSNWSVRASWRARRALDNARTRQPFDCVFFHTQVTSLFSIGIMRQVPAIISLDATPINYDSVGEYYGHQAAGNGFLDRQKYVLNKRAFHAAAALVTWSEWAKRSLVEDYEVDADRVRVFPPGAPELYFEIGRQRVSTPAQHTDRPLRLLFIGGDFRRKGGPELLEVMRGPVGHRFTLDVVTQADVAALPNVHVHRNVQPNSPTLRRLLSEADLFVLPTYADCLAVVLEEAAAAGLPVVTTRVGALAESVEEGQSGLLVDAGDISGLSLALATLADDPARRTRMGRAAFALAERKFSAAKNTRAILDLLRGLVYEQRERLAA
jgi:glycosyltransferase involved in cell wall biosynthesis